MSEMSEVCDHMSEMSDSEKNLLGFVKFVGAFVLAVPSAILTGWVVSVLWGWFAVPLGVMPLSVAHAVGITVLGHGVFGWLVRSISSLRKTPEAHQMKVIEGFVFCVLLNLMLLAEGWVIHRFFM